MKTIRMLAVLVAATITTGFAADTPASEPSAAPVPVVVDEGRTWYWRPLRPAELLDRKVRHLRLAQTDAEDAATAAADALAKVTKNDLDRRNAVGIVRPFWFDTSADAVKGASLLKVIKASHLANEEAEAAAKVQAAANDLEAASRRLLGRVELEVKVAATNVRGNTIAAARDAAAAATIATEAKAEEERRAAAVPAKQGNL